MRYLANSSQDSCANKSLFYTQHLLDHLLCKFGSLGDLFNVRPHVAHHKVTVLLDLRAGCRDALREIHLFEEIPKHIEPGPLREYK